MKELNPDDPQSPTSGPEDSKQSEELLSQLANRRRRARERLEETSEQPPSETTLSARDRAKQRLARKKASKQQEGGVADDVTPMTLSPDEGGVSPDSARQDALSPTMDSPGKLKSSGTMSLKASMKQKMADRIRAAREKAKEEVEEEAPIQGRKLAGIRDKTRPTRFDDPAMLSRHEKEVEEELRRSLKLKTERKEKLKPEGSPLLPTAEEQYDFFTRKWEPEPEEIMKKIAKPAEPKPTTSEAPAEGEEAEGVEEGKEITEEGEEAKKEDKKKRKYPEEGKEDEVPLLDDVGDIAEEMWKYYAIGQAEYKPHKDKMEDEAKTLYVPQILPAKIEDKIFEQQQPRYLEDEGFYVGQKPVVPRRNFNRMENRLLKNKERNQNWFGQDGRLISLPDPLKELPSRPPILEENEDHLSTDYQKAILTEFDSRYIDGSLDSYGQYQIDVDINTVTFSHHHLFSREHVLAYKLVDLCKQHDFKTKNRTSHYLTEKLKALKAASYHVQDNIAQIKAQSKEGDTNKYADLEHRLNEYRIEIRETRQNRDVELRSDRNLMRNIIATWKQIKSLRQFQDFTNTTVKLQIRKVPTDKAEDQKEWDREVQEEIEEMRDEYEQDYNDKVKEYKATLEKWKKQRLDRKNAKSRQKERRIKEKLKKKKKKSTARGEGEDTQESQGEDLENVDETGDEQDTTALLEKDQEILEAEGIQKPEKPQPFDEAAYRQRVLEKFDEIRRKPGEPHLIPEMTNSATVTQTKLCPRGGQQRRNDLARCKCYIRILFNDKEVSRTPAKPIGQEFTVRFAQIFNVQIVQWPESIRFQIYETSGLSSTLISELYIGIPDSNVTSDNLELDILDFSSDNRVSHAHEGVGSGFPFSFEADNSNMVICNTSGKLAVGAAWAVDSQGNVLVPSMNRHTGHQLGAMKGLDAVAAIGATGVSDPEQLLKWISKSRLDPNDPANASLMAMLKPAMGGGGDATHLEMKNHFRLEQLQQEFDFMTDRQMEASRRFKLIQYREEEIPDFRNYQMIPAFDSEVPEEVFLEFERRKREEQKVKQMDETEAHRVAVAKFMQNVREQVLKRFRLAQHQKTLEDMVSEEMVPNIGTILPAIMKLAEPRHPLRPHRKERKKMTAANLVGVDVKLLCNIVRAFDIPVRAEALQGGGPAAAPSQPGLGGTLSGTRSLGTMGLGDSIRASGRQSSTRVKDISGDVLVRPFVEIMFQRNTVATTVADGPNPSWNEELKLSFKAPNNDYSSANLQTVKDMVFINLFDEYVIDMVQDDRERGTNIHRRIEKRWLGTIKIPFSTIYFNGRIDGTFRVDKPPVLLGYTHDTGPSQLDQDINIGAGEIDQTYLTMFITIEPPLQPAEPAKEKFDSNEDEKLLQAAEAWQKDVSSKFPKREYKTTVVDINGKSVFITRYFKPLKPPEELINNQPSPESVVDQIVRFVSLIPFVSDSVVFPGLCDIWSTCDQFLQMLQGDEEEHAVLLCNYFMHLGKETWLLLGDAVPEGPTAYVLTREKREGYNKAIYYIWNASTGESYHYRDNYCPLQSVGCLVNANNIWANIQPNAQPSRISFDLSNTSNWKPFFHKGFPHPGLSSIQPENLIYIPTNKIEVLDIQEKIERTLKEKIMEWRPRHITRWNRYCNQAFRDLLKKLEMSHGKGVQQEHSTELEHILGSYKMNGFPINQPYTTMEPLIEAVFATGVHTNETSDVEFALAVNVHAYPNSVLSVWVYVASLIRKR